MSDPSACCGERVGERLERLRPDLEPRCGTVAAEALQQMGARAERAVQVEGRHRPARALPRVVAAGDHHDRAPVPLHEPRGDDADHALVPVLAPEHVPAPAPQLLGPGVDAGDRLAQDPVLDGLPVAVERLELGRQALCLVRVVGEDQLERDVRAREPAGGVDTGREAEADGRRVDRGRVDPRRAHERPQTRLARPCQRAQPGARERPVLVDERHDVGDRRERDEVEMAGDGRVVGPEQRLRELVDDAGAAELGERVRRRARRDDRAVGQRLAGPVVVGDDHVDAERPARVPPRRRR